MRENQSDVMCDLDNAIFDCGKVEALMKAIEATYLDASREERDMESENDRVYAFYALWDAIHRVRGDLDKILLKMQEGE